MSEVLDRTIEEPSVEQRQRSGPPKEMPDIERLIRPRWPRSAIVTTVVLGTLAFAGATGTVVQYFGDENADDQVAQLSDENAEFRAENADLVEDIDQLEADQLDLAAELDTTSTRLAAVSARNVALSERIGDLQTDIGALSDERDALVAMFPMLVDTSLVGVDVTGDYSVAWLPVYNNAIGGLTLPAASQVSISSTAAGWLHITIPGVVEADLHRTDGAL